MKKIQESTLRRVMAGFFCLALAIGVARFASTTSHLLYGLFLLLLVPALAACLEAPIGRRELLLAVLGLALMVQAAFQPAVEARGYVLAAVGWLALVSTLWLGRDRGLLRGIFLFLILLGTADALYGLLQAIGGVDRIGTWERGLKRVATGTYINRNHFAGLLNMTLALSLGAMFTGYVERRRRELHRAETFAWTWLVLLSCAIVGLAVLLSLSRAGSLVLLATLLFVFVLLQVERGRGRPGLPARVTAILLAATLGLGLAYGIDALIDRFGDISEPKRAQVYRDTLELIADHPWRGVGPGLYRWRFRPYQSLTTDRIYSHTHNDYLQVAAEWGLPLAALFWGFVGWRLSRAVRLFLSPAEPWRRGVALGSAGAIFSILLHSLVDFNLQIPANLAVFAAILGLAWAAEPSAASGPPATSGKRP